MESGIELFDFFFFFKWLVSCPDIFPLLVGLKYTFLLCGAFVKDKIIEWQLETRVGRPYRNFERYTYFEALVFSYKKDKMLVKMSFSSNKGGTVA